MLIGAPEKLAVPVPHVDTRRVTVKTSTKRIIDISIHLFEINLLSPIDNILFVVNNFAWY
jgi:hypothetical protein